MSAGAFVNRLLRLRLIDRNELRYLRGVAKSVSRMQRTASHARNHANNRIRENQKLRAQIRRDQVYIDALEAQILAETVQEIRARMRTLHGTGGRYG